MTTVERISRARFVVPHFRNAVTTISVLCALIFVSISTPARSVTISEFLALSSEDAAKVQRYIYSAVFENAFAESSDESKQCVSDLLSASGDGTAQIVERMKKALADDKDAQIADIVLDVMQINCDPKAFVARKHAAAQKRFDVTRRALDQLQEQAESEYKIAQKNYENLLRCSWETPDGEKVFKQYGADKRKWWWVDTEGERIPASMQRKVRPPSNPLPGEGCSVFLEGQE